MLAAAIAEATARNERELATKHATPSTPFDNEALAILQNFTRFCASAGVKSCPATPTACAAFIRAEAARGVDEKTIAAATNAIEMLHDHHGLPNPIATASVRLELTKVLQIQPPRAWRKDEKLLWAALPPEIRVVIERRERDTETAMRRAQNEAADLRKRHSSADETADNKETTS